jgi:hypothetical protein
VPGRLREPGLRDAYDAIIEPMRDLADPGQVPDAFEAEAMVSVLVGMVYQACPDVGLVTTALLDVVDELRRSSLPHAYLGLRTLAVIGPAEVREAAARAADSITEPSGMPPWTGQLGQVTPIACAALADPYGETETLLCEFAYAGGGRAHGVVATFDATWHGSAVQLTIVNRPDRIRRRLDRQARRDGVTVREIAAPDAARLFQAGIGAFMRHGRPPGVGARDDAYGEFCASISIARHRADALEGGAQPQEPGDQLTRPDLAAEWPHAARHQIADEFLGSPFSEDLQGPVVRKMPMMLITTCVSALGCDPLLIGPRLLERILLHVFPRTLTGPDRFGNEVPPFMRAWTSWLADRRGMPGRQRTWLMFRLEFLLNRFPVVWADRSANPLRRYVQDLSDEVASDGEAMFKILERRTFAVPRPGSRGDGVVEARGNGRERNVDELDAADETDRTLITLLGVSERGLPQHRFASHTAVTRQLWADDPPEVWAAAQRMLAAGQSREAVLDRLAKTWDDSAAGQAGRYNAALARLAPPRLR